MKSKKINDNLYKALILLLLLGSIGFSSCLKNNAEEASKSLIGTWNIDSHITYYGTLLNMGSSSDSSSVLTENAGSMEAKASFIDIQLMIGGNEERIQSTYRLINEKVNSGFTKVNKYYLQLDQSVIEVEYGDGTSDSHESAENIALYLRDTIDNSITEKVLKLSKQ